MTCQFRVLLCILCQFPLQHSTCLATKNRNTPPPTAAPLHLYMYADAYGQRNLSLMSSKIALNDVDGHIFPTSCPIPKCSMLITWRELPKMEHGKWLQLQCLCNSFVSLCKSVLMRRKTKNTFCFNVAF